MRKRSSFQHTVFLMVNIEHLPSTFLCVSVVWKWERKKSKNTTSDRRYQNVLFFHVRHSCHISSMVRCQRLNKVKSLTFHPISYSLMEEIYETLESWINYQLGYQMCSDQVNNIIHRQQGTNAWLSVCQFKINQFFEILSTVCFKSALVNMQHKSEKQSTIRFK